MSSELAQPTATVRRAHARGSVRRVALACAALLALAASASAAPIPAGRSLHAWPEDRARLRALDRHGVAMVGAHVVARFPKDSLSDARMREIVGRLDRGIAEAKRLVNRPDWEFRGDRRVFFYFADGNFISHAPGGNVAFVPLWRIRDDEAPWMHESLHLLLASATGDWLAESEKRANARMPLWLHEGLAEALAMEASAHAGLPHYSPLIDVPPDRLDSLCVARLRDAPADRVLASIGARGKLPELFGPERMRVAPAFYTASTSFVRHLIARHGLEALLAAIDDFDREIETLEQRTGTALSDARADWLLEIGYGSGGKP